MIRKQVEEMTCLVIERPSAKLEMTDRYPTVTIWPYPRLDPQFGWKVGDKLKVTVTIEDIND